MNGTTLPRQLLPFCALISSVALGCAPNVPQHEKMDPSTSTSSSPASVVPDRRGPGPEHRQDNPDPALFPDELRSRAVSATVLIHDVTQNSDGTGVIVGDKEDALYILTANHVVKSNTDQLEISIFPPDKLKDAVIYQDGKVEARSEIGDLALIRLPMAKAAAGVLRLCSPKEIPEGKDFPALSVGCERGKPTANREKVIARRTIQKQGQIGMPIVFETEAMPKPGRSGGPLVDQEGRVIGICHGDGDGKGYYIHPEQIHKFLRLNQKDWLWTDVKRP